MEKEEKRMIMIMRWGLGERREGEVECREGGDAGQGCRENGGEKN